MGDKKTITEIVYNILFGMPRFAPAQFAFFLFIALLFFLKDFSENQKLFLVPALLVYTLGAAILGFLNRVLGYDFEKAMELNNEKTIPLALRILLRFFHIVWFIVFIYYLFSKSVL